MTAKVKDVASVESTPSDDIWSGLLKLDAFAALLNQMATAHSPTADEWGKPLWSLYYTTRGIHKELEAAYNRLAD